MKLTGIAAQNYLRKPDPAHSALLIFGADPMRVATGRQQAIAALAGPNADSEMRLTRINAADLRKDPAQLLDAIKAQGFFAGHRVVFVEDAADGLVKPLDAALCDWQQGDAQMVVTAGSLTAKSTLRKLFENHGNSIAIGLYDDPPTQQDVELALRDAGLPPPDRDIAQNLLALAQTLEPGDFRQTIDKIALYKLGDATPLTVADIMANAPQSAEVDMDDVIDIVAMGQPDRLGPALRNLYAQGVTPVALSISAMRHFRRLHTVLSDQGGVAAGVGRLRPPVFGPRRDRLVQQASRWGPDRVERGLTVLTDVDLQLRSADSAPAYALLERVLIRLAMIGRG